MPRLSVLIATALVTAVTAPRLAAQTTHRITLSHAAGSSEYQVRPDRVTARAGDILVFRGTGGDHSIIFEDGIPAAARTALAAAMPRRVGALAGPMFGADTEYRIVLPALPAGQYRFYCLPHRAYDEVGVLIIQ